MNPRAWLIMTRNQFLGFVREPAASGFNLLVPFFIVVIQAIAYGRTKVSGLKGYEVVDVLPISAATMFVMIIGIFGMSIGLASMIEARSVATYRLRPGGVSGLLSAYASVLFTLIVVGLGVSTAVLVVGWSARLPDRPLVIIPSLLLSALFFIAFGAAGAGLGGSPRSAQAMSSALFFPFLFLSGAMFPLDDFPKPLRIVGGILPGSHVYDLFTYCWIGKQSFPTWSVLYLVVGAGLLCVAAIRIVSRREDV